MRNFFLLFLTACFCSLHAQEPDVLHYGFSIDLNDQNDTIKAVASIRFRIPANRTEVRFDLTSVKPSGKGMNVLGVQDYNRQKLSFSQTGEHLLIKLSSAKPEQGVLIEYKGIPNDGLIISKNKFGDRTFFADNWPNRAHHWLPCNDRPDDKASVEFIVRAPKQYRVVSNGVVTEAVPAGENKFVTHWKEDTPLPTKVMVIGVAKFATRVFDDSPKDVPVSAWVYPQDSAKALSSFAITPSILRFFSGYIAPYPFTKLANVQSKTIFGGMENAGCIFYDENVGTRDLSDEALFAHEIAHQWFGDAASEKSFAHVWLSEGFATYLTHVYFEQKYGRDAFLQRMKKDRETVVAFARQSSRPVVDSSADLMSLLNANSYQKGGWVLHMLRQEVGDSAFHKIIQTYYARYNGGNADSRDFEAVAEQVSGKELTWFFDQWLYGPGVPELKIEKSVKGNDYVLKVTQAGNRLFRFKLPFRLQSEGGGYNEGDVIVDKQEATFRWPGLGPSAVRFDVDPDVQLLFVEKK